MNNNAHTYMVMKEYNSPYPNSIIFNKGDNVNIGNEFTDDPDWKDWIWCEKNNEIKAWIPKQYVDKKKSKGILKRDYNAMELSVSIGEELKVTEIINGFGMSEKKDGTKGWVPLKNLKIIE